MEVPMKFETRNPVSGESMVIDLTKGVHFMAAAGPLDAWGGANYHGAYKNTAVNVIAIEDTGAATTSIAAPLPFVWVSMAVFAMKLV